MKKIIQKFKELARWKKLLLITILVISIVSMLPPDFAGFLAVALLLSPLYFLFKRIYKKRKEVNNKIKPETKICEHCKTSIPFEATKCPQCQSDLRSWERRRPILAGVCVIAIIIFTFSMIEDVSTPHQPISQEESFKNMKENALSSFGRSYIENILKSPSTAKFSYSPAVTQDPKDKNLFEVISHVDSENSFGAMIRSTWSIKAQYVGTDNRDFIETGENWKIVEIYFDGKKIK